MTSATKYKRILNLLKSISLFETILLSLAIISANYAAYISYFDLNVLAIADASSISRHVFGLTIPFILASATVTVLLTVLQQIISNQKRINSAGITIHIPRSVRHYLHSLLGNRITRFICSVILFCIFYLGVIGSLLVLMFFFVYFSTIAVLNHNFEKDKSPSEESNTLIEDQEKSKNKDVESKVSIRFKFFGFKLAFLNKLFNDTGNSFSKSLSDLNNQSYIKFLASKIGVMLIFLALSLGYGRAHFVSDNSYVYVNGETTKKVLFLTTSSGVALFDPTERTASFISWGKVNNLTFLKKNRRSIESGLFVSPKGL